MNTRYFDSLTKRLGMRRSRRTDHRANSLPRQQHLLALQSAPQATDRFVAITLFPYEGNARPTATELKPLLRLMQQQPGFITLSFIQGDEAIYLITTFLDQTTSDNARAVLDEWIATTDQQPLIATPEYGTGAVFLQSGLDTGCRCYEDDIEPCGSSDLICCTLPGRTHGLCLTAATTCPGTTEATTDDDDDDTPSDNDPASASQNMASCVGEGCSCTLDGTDPCPGGLVCCATDTNSGICLTACPCGNEGCACIAGVVNTCDDGLLCCAPGEIGGNGTCQYSCTCTEIGCSCTTGVDGTCDTDLVCCGIGSSAPGSIGVCLTGCSDAHCPGGEGCECGSVWQCDPGLACCGASEIDETGICQTEC